MTGTLDPPAALRKAAFPEGRGARVEWHGRVAFPRNFKVISTLKRGPIDSAPANTSVH